MTDDIELLEKEIANLTELLKLVSFGTAAYEVTWNKRAELKQHLKEIKTSDMIAEGAPVWNEAE